MTDYEDDFTGFNEIVGEMPVEGLNQLSDRMPELWP